MQIKIKMYLNSIRTLFQIMFWKSRPFKFPFFFLHFTFYLITYFVTIFEMKSNLNYFYYTLYIRQYARAHAYFVCVVCKRACRVRAGMSARARVYSARNILLYITWFLKYIVSILFLRAFKFQLK